MTIRLSEWHVSARIASEILGVPVETFRTWRKRHGLLPQAEWAGPGRAPEKMFQFRHLLQARVAQKLMGVGVPVGQACEAASYGAFRAFMARQDIRVGFTDRAVNPAPDLDEDVFLTFSLENDGIRIARQLADDIATHRGDETGKIALDDFLKAIRDNRAQLRGEM